MSGPKPRRPVRGSTTGRPIMALFDLAGRRWTLRIIWELHENDAPLSFRALRERCDAMSSSVLTARLNGLREAQLVELGDDGFTLTALGRSLVANMRPLLAWADEWAEATSVR